MRFLCALLCSLFWWVPAKWSTKRIEEGQEAGCDFQCKKYGVDGIDLAAAIYKSAKQIVLEKPSVAFVKKHQARSRIDALLQPVSPKKAHIILTAFAGCAAFFEIFLGRFWMF